MIGLYKLLSPGEDNALTTTDLSALTGMSERLVRKRIRAERLSGAPILSSGKGYFLPASGAELRRFARSIAHAAEKAAAEADGQAQIAGW